MSRIPTITNNQIRYYVKDRDPFVTSVYGKGSNATFRSRGEWIKSGHHNDAIYVVYSYTTPIYLWCDGEWYSNPVRYSNTTDRLRYNCRLSCARLHEMSAYQMEYLITWGVNKYKQKFIN